MLSVREISETDIPLIIAYWLEATPQHLTGMGVDLDKMPSREAWDGMLREQLSQSYPEKKSYGIIWQVDGEAVGHSNINKIVFGKEAFMHLHLWKSDLRHQGVGTALLRLTLPFFFENYGLEKLFCEPYALNPAPNRTLEKIGFRLVSEQINTPGWLNFEQPTKLWELSREQYLQR